MKSRPITFFSSELKTFPSRSFLAGFRDARDRAVAEYLIDWAIKEGLKFRSSRGHKRLIEYVVIPAAEYPKGSYGEPLLTLQQANDTEGPWDIPFGRMRGLVLGREPVKRRLFDRLNGILSSGSRLPEKALELGADGRSWGQRPYRALHDPLVLEKFVTVLAEAHLAVKARDPELLGGA
jgi:hypothetical protein